MKRVQCQFCGRVRRSDGTWARDDYAVITVLGQCATCMDQQHRAHERAEKAWMRRLRQGKSKTKPSADPWPAVRHDVGDEFWKGE